MQTAQKLQASVRELSQARAHCCSWRLTASRAPLSMTQVVSMVKNHVLRPIIDTAARLGEEVLSSRAAQEAFERRSVHKYAFTVAPLHCAEASPTQHGSDGGRSGGSDRGIAVFPEIGQVVSVSGKSTLVAHREILSLQYLRRSFLRIGRRAVWGKVRTGNVVLSWECGYVLKFGRLILVLSTIHRLLLLGIVNFHFTVIFAHNSK